MKHSVVHLYVYGQLKKIGGNTVHISQIHPIIRWHCRIPRKIQIEFLKELCEVGLLKKLDRDTYELVNIHRKPLCDSLGNPLW